MAEERVIGIDLGTTNSLVAYMENGTATVLPGEDGSRLVPSIVAAISTAGAGRRPELIVGNAAARVLATEPANAVYSVKRLMGRGVEDVQDELKLFPFHLAPNLQSGEVLRLTLGGTEFTPSELSAHILRQLKRNAERYFGSSVGKAVITVPAYFNDAQRQATKDAGRMAGLEVLRLVNEPTAAALAYGLDKAKEGLIAVYDFGGGTFDISILRLHEGIFEVIATNGDTHLGGDDIDNLLLAVAIEDIRGDLGVDVRQDAVAVQAVRHAVIDAKIALSFAEEAKLDVELPGGKRYLRTLLRPQFEELIAPVLARTATPCRQAMADAGIAPDQIDEVVLVGGSTRIPAVRALVADIFGLSARGKTPHVELNPDEVVALGAAVQANILAGGSLATENMLLLDITPLSLGIEALGGVVAKIIQRNSTIPASATEHFTTGVEGQSNVAIHVLQGERELAKDCRSLARFDLKGIPPLPAGIPRIEVRFIIDANGILQVTASELRSGIVAEVEVKPTYGLTDEQVETMILDSFDFADEDFAARQLIEAKNEAESILAHLDKAKSGPAWAELGEADKEKIAAARAVLEQTKAGDDLDAVRNATHELDAVTRGLAERMMDMVTSTVTGQSMEHASETLGEGPAAPHPIAPAEFQ